MITVETGRFEHVMEAFDRRHGVAAEDEWITKRLHREHTDIVFYQ